MHESMDINMDIKWLTYFHLVRLQFKSQKPGNDKLYPPGFSFLLCFLCPQVLSEPSAFGARGGLRPQGAVLFFLCEVMVVLL